MYYAVFVSGMKQAMDMPHRAQVDADFGVVADGIGLTIEDAVRMALRKDRGLSQLAVLQGDEVGGLSNGRAIFRPTEFVWCLPRAEAEEEVREVYAADEPEPDPLDREPIYQESARRTASGKPSKSSKGAGLGKYAAGLVLVALAAIGGSVYLSHRNNASNNLIQQLANAPTTPVSSLPTSNLPYAQPTPSTQQSTQSQPPASSVQVSTGNASPTAPSSLQVVSTGPSVQLSWVGAAGSNQYVVFRSNSPDQSTAQPVTTTLQTTYTDNSVQPLQTYYYWVAASSNGGTTWDPNYVTVKVSYSFDQLHSMYAQDIVTIQDMTAQQAAGDLTSYTTAGTGFWLSNGDIATCYHVVKGNWARINIKGYSGNPYLIAARVIWTDPAHDLAVLSPESPVAPIPSGLQLSDTYSTGEQVGVLGHPGGEALTMTTGTIQGTMPAEDVSNYGILPNMIAMNTPAVGGNSGSPVLNGYGQVIGIVESAGAHNGDQSYAVQAQYLSGY